LNERLLNVHWHIERQILSTLAVYKDVYFQFSKKVKLNSAFAPVDNGLFRF
jgi:hypothetical protein